MGQIDPQHDLLQINTTNDQQGAAQICICIASHCFTVLLIVFPSAFSFTSIKLKHSWCIPFCSRSYAITADTREQTVNCNTVIEAGICVIPSFPSNGNMSSLWRGNGEERITHCCLVLCGWNKSDLGWQTHACVLFLFVIRNTAVIALCCPYHSVML